MLIVGTPRKLSLGDFKFQISGHFSVIIVFTVCIEQDEHKRILLLGSRKPTLNNFVSAKQ
jgi:hypothetical protein